MKKIILSITSSLVIISSAYASIPELKYIAGNDQHIIDADVIGIAVKKTLYPKREMINTETRKRKRNIP